jgi:hypothetical protein
MNIQKLEELSAAAHLEYQDENAGFDKFNEFCREVEKYLTEEQLKEWENFSLKATSNEIIGEAMRMVRSN